MIYENLSTGSFLLVFSVMILSVNQFLRRFFNLLFSNVISPAVRIIIVDLSIDELMT